MRKSASKFKWWSKKEELKAVGLTKGGLNTKIHTIVDALGNPLEFMLSPGNEHDSKYAVNLLAKTDIENSNILADKAYGTKAIRDYITQRNANYTIPPKSNTKTPWDCDFYLYKERHVVECFFQKIKWFRRIFTRYDKKDRSFLAFIYIAAISILLR